MNSSISNIYMIVMYFIILLGFLSNINQLSIVNGQLSGTNLDGLINQVFRTNGNNNNQMGQRRGFNEVVTPITNTGNEQIDFQSIRGRMPCNCVPYHMCDLGTTSSNMDSNSNNNEGSFDGFGLIDLRINADDPVCEHFLDICCEQTLTRPTNRMPNSQNQRPNRLKGCGVRNVGGIDFKITDANDNEAGFGEFPWTVALLHANNMSYFCAGSLIHSRVVLTAVHCVNKLELGNYIVRAGEWDTQTTKERLPYEERRIMKVLLHPRFNIRNVAYNFALLILNAPVTIGDHINVVCLPSSGSIISRGISCISTGWGKDVFGAEGRYSAIMKRVSLPIIDHNTCERQLRTTRLGSRFVLDSSFICAGGQQGIDTCQGDGGAPLVCPTGLNNAGRYIQNGIVSWGIGCYGDIPAAYSNVALARQWIDEQMLMHGFDPASYTPF